jgi:predicted nucleotidyltransferase
MISQRQILQLADQIASRFKPDRILLFGSYAYGTPTADSDVDLLLIMASTRPTMDIELEIREAIRAPFAFDIVVRTPNEIAQRIAWKDCFITEILGRGKSLYEATDTRMGRQGGSRLSHRAAGTAGKEKSQSRRRVLPRAAVAQWLNAG